MQRVCLHCPGGIDMTVLWRRCATCPLSGGASVSTSFRPAIRPGSTDRQRLSGWIRLRQPYDKVTDATGAVVRLRCIMKGHRQERLSWGSRLPHVLYHMPFSDLQISADLRSRRHLRVGLSSCKHIDLDYMQLTKHVCTKLEIYLLQHGQHMKDIQLGHTSITTYLV